MDKDLVEIFALWENTSQAGDVYFTGYMGNADVVVFKNQYKKEPKHPDYRVFVKRKKEKKSFKPSSSKPKTPQIELDDDVPF